MKPVTGTIALTSGYGSTKIPTAAFLLNESAGVPHEFHAYDTAQSLPASLGGSAAWVNVGHGPAVYCGAATDYVALPNLTQFKATRPGNGTETFSVIVVLKCPTPNASGHCSVLASKPGEWEFCTYGAAALRFYYRKSVGGQIFFQNNDGGGNFTGQRLVLGMTISADSASNSFMYINGSQRSRAAGSGSGAADTTKGIYLGGLPGAQASESGLIVDPLNGCVEALLFFKDIALSAADHAAFAADPYLWLSRPLASTAAGVVLTNQFPTASIPGAVSFAPNCNIRTVTQTIVEAGELHLRYVGASGHDAISPNSYTVAASLDIAGVLYPVTWNGGAHTVTVAPGAQVDSDPVRRSDGSTLIIGEDAILAVNQHFTLAGGGELPIATSSISLDANTLPNLYESTCLTNLLTGGDQSATDETSTGISATIGSYANTFLPCPMILGKPTGNAVPVVLIGDSILAGQGDSSGLGFGVRTMLALRLPFINVSIGGETANVWGQVNAYRLNCAKTAGATSAIIALGHNDIGGNRTVAQLTTDLTTLATLLRANGFTQLYLCTVTPSSINTSGTDGFSSLIYLAPSPAFLKNNSNAAIRANFRAYGYDAYFETAAAFEYQPDTGIVHPNSSPTSFDWNADGTHPGALGHQGMERALIEALQTFVLNPVGAPVTQTDIDNIVAALATPISNIAAIKAKTDKLLDASGFTVTSATSTSLVVAGTSPDTDANAYKGAIPRFTSGLAQDSKPPAVSASSTTGSTVTLTFAAPGLASLPSANDTLVLI
jgi:lysophospholipase L1-like esterase